MEIEKLKKAVGYCAADLVESGMKVGIGTGSTVFYFIERLSQRVQSGLFIHAVCSSLQSENLAKNQKIPLIDLGTLQNLDITVDGADEIDSRKWMIKGGGGALLREKILASISKEMIVIIDESKLSLRIGKAKLPIEITPFAHAATVHRIENLGFQVQYRKNARQELFVTDNGNLIIDLVHLTQIEDPEALHSTLKKIPGVVETGLFINMAGRVIVGFKDGQVIIKP